MMDVTNMSIGEVVAYRNKLRKRANHMKVIDKIFGIGLPTILVAVITYVVITVPVK